MRTRKVKEGLEVETKSIEKEEGSARVSKKYDLVFRKEEIERVTVRLIA